MGLSYRSTDLQTANIRLGIVRGFFEPPIFEGEDDIVVGASGREPGEWIADVRRILLEGEVIGTGSSLVDQQVSWNTNTAALMALLDRTLAAGDLVVSAPHLGIPSSTAITLATSAAADDIIDTSAAHGLAAGDPVYFSALTGGTGLSTSTIYYVIAANLGATTFQVSTQQGGAAQGFSADITAGTVNTATSRKIAASCYSFTGGPIVASRYQRWSIELESISSPPEWEPST